MKSKLTLKLFFSLLISSILFTGIFAGESFSQSIDSQAKKGLDEAYNFEWKKAENIFKDLIIKYPDDPRGYHYEARVYAWYYLSNRSKNIYNYFVDYSDSTIEKTKALLEAKPDNANLLYLMGSAYTYRAIIFARAENYLDAIWASKKSESYLSEALAKDSSTFDAYLGLGLYNFAIGQVPSAFKWALSLAGIDGDQDTGLKYLRLAAQKGNFSKVEAQYYLAQILSEVVFNYKQSEDYIKNLVRKYPGNLLFQYTYGVLELKQKNLNNSQKILKKLIYRNDTSFVKIISFSNFLMGDIFYKKNQFDSAEVYYHRFLDSTPDKDYTGIAGDRKSAQLFFSEAGQGNMDLEDDLFAKRKGEIYTGRPPTKNELSLIRFENLIEAKKFKLATDSLNNILDSLKSKDIKAETFYFLSQTAYETGKYDQCISLADSAIKVDNDTEKWVPPFASYYAAASSKKLGKKNMLQFYLEKADNYNDYDYQNKLKNLLDTIRPKD